MSSAKTCQPLPDQGRPQEASVPAPRGPVVGLSSSKVQSWHLDRLAFVYVRQSSPQQVLEHRESRLRQYALVDYAVALGWPKDRVQVIDEDQGQSGRDAENRAGFQRLLAEVAIDHVGIVLGLEMSRLRLATFGPGQFVGEMGYIDGKLRSATAKADSTVDALLLDRTAIAVLVEQQPAIALKITRNIALELSHRVRSTSARLTEETNELPSVWSNSVMGGLARA